MAYPYQSHQVKVSTVVTTAIRSEFTENLIEINSQQEKL